MRPSAMMLESIRSIRPPSVVLAFAKKLAVVLLKKFAVVALIAALFSPHFSREVAVAPGELDPTFGNGGKVTTDFAGQRDQAFALAVQPNQKIIVAGAAITASGQTSDFALARFNADGSLDASFGVAGKVTTDFAGGPDVIVALALQPDGKIVVAGTACVHPELGCSTASVSNTNGLDFALARYNSNGSLDISFGIGGKVTTDFSGGGDGAFAVAIQADGKIVAGGTTRVPNPVRHNFDFALARYNENGSLDTGFGTGGKIVSDFLDDDDMITSLAVSPDGKIIAAGWSYTTTTRDYALARYTANGSLDPTFGSGGRVTTDFFSTASSRRRDVIAAIALQPDGKLVAVGSSESDTPAEYMKFTFARYNVNGQLDTSFGSGGKASASISDYDDQATSVAIQSDGKILVGGMAGGIFRFGLDFFGAVPSAAGNPNFALVRLNTDGSLDTSFGIGGKVNTDFFGGIDAARIALQADGKVVAAGAASRSLINRDLTDADFALARYEGTRTAPSGPVITGASISGKMLFITGQGFSDEAKLLLDGVKQKTANDEQSPATTLIARKAGKLIERGQTVMLQVQNSDGALSNRFAFTRPAN